jgi:preprotein translocase subunit SecA
MHWIDHLEAMEYLRQSVNLRSYGQRDPLVEYKREGLKIFKDMEAGINAQVLSLIPTIGAGAFQAEEQKLRDVQKKAQLIGGSETSTEAIKSQNPTVMVSSADGEKVGRNDKIIVTKNGEEKEIKFKKLDQHQKEGWVIKK